MVLRPVIFEDHVFARMRPVAWSQPVHELRCGLFNLRERVEAVAGSSPPGVVLMRDLLSDLHRGSRWRVGWTGGGEDRDLWLAARLGPRWDVLRWCAGSGAGGPDSGWLWFDGQGLVAAVLTQEQGRTVADAWNAWAGSSAVRTAATGAGTRPPAWRPDPAGLGAVRVSAHDGHELWTWGGEDGSSPWGAAWRDLLDRDFPVLDWVWDLVPATAAALAADLDAAAGVLPGRTPFGIEAGTDEPGWAGSTDLVRGRTPAGVTVLGDPAGLHLGPGVTCEPGVVVDVRPGPVALDRDVTVQSACRLEGPLYAGMGSLFKAGCRVSGPGSFGLVNRLAGEIGETVAGDFVNKQHDGFLGHAVLGSWINLGALTTCSDLKNNYGTVRVDLGYGAVDTGRRFVGLMAGDHAKTAIGTLFNTGCVVGFAANIFGPGPVPKLVRNFAWGGGEDDPDYDLPRALDTAATVMGRRGCLLTSAHRALFGALSAGT